MNNYIIDRQISIQPGMQIYLLNIDINTGLINTSIIPARQLDEIGGYTIRKDANKRLLARSFLYEYLLKQYSVSNFELDYNEYKKPFLKATPDFHFSFSYAHDYLLVAISVHKKIGADIEYINPAISIHEIAAELMCPAELLHFDSLNGNAINQRVYFFKLFAAKESIIKSFGTGLYFEVKHLNILSDKSFNYLDAGFVYQDLGVWMDRYSLAISYEQ
ncbi:MAG: 4'-phosphopantetheinyl transferase superfamily protein [Chitinophagaceae bacterium]